MKVLAIILARGSSKGLPLKNIRKLAGKPLIVHTILTAKRADTIDKIIVSTDSPKIAKIAKSLSVEAPFLRPKNLSHDTTPPIDVIKHALRFLSNTQSFVPEIIVILQPTSPLRTKEMIDKSVLMLKKSKTTSVISVSEIKNHPYISFWYSKKYLRPFKQDFEKHSRRQSRPPLFCPTGAITTLWNNTLQKYNSLYGPKIKPLVVKEKEINIDIDDLYDLFISEMTMKYWKGYRKRSHS